MHNLFLCAAGCLLAVTTFGAMAATSAAQERPAASRLEPVPDKLVVLTFDDSKASHYTVVRPLLKKYGFGATFFITEGFTFRTNKEEYLTGTRSASSTGMVLKSATTPGTTRVYQRPICRGFGST